MNYRKTVEYCLEQIDNLSVEREVVNEMYTEAKKLYNRLCEIERLRGNVTVRFDQQIMPVKMAFDVVKNRMRIYKQDMDTLNGKIEHYKSVIREEYNGKALAHDYCNVDDYTRDVDSYVEDIKENGYIVGILL